MLGLRVGVQNILCGIFTEAVQKLLCQFVCPTINGINCFCVFVQILVFLPFCKLNLNVAKINEINRQVNMPNKTVLTIGFFKTRFISIRKSDKQTGRSSVH